MDWMAGLWRWRTAKLSSSFVRVGGFSWVGSLAMEEEPLAAVWVSEM